MMFFLLSILLLASTTAAQLTTSIALGKYYFGTDKIGFYGSVIGVSNSYTTMTLDLDNGTRLFNSRSLPGIWTISPTSFEVNFSNEDDQNQSCSWPASPPDAPGSCMISYGPNAAQNALCQSDELRTSYTTYTHTYSERLSYLAGEEILTQTFVFGPSSGGFPVYCTETESHSAWSSTAPLDREYIATYQVVVRAGQEKLSATPGTSAGGSGAVPTGTRPGVGSTGAAMPMKTVGPVVVGLGAAVAAFL
jgi:hypothetical protein